MKIKSGLNLEKKRIVWRIQVTEKLKKKENCYCKKQIVSNILEDNWLKGNLKTLCYNYLLFTLW